MPWHRDLCDRSHFGGVLRETIVLLHSSRMYEIRWSRRDDDGMMVNAWKLEELKMTTFEVWSSRRVYYSVPGGCGSAFRGWQKVSSENYNLLPWRRYLPKSSYYDKYDSYEITKSKLQRNIMKRERKFILGCWKCFLYLKVRFRTIKLKSHWCRYYLIVVSNVSVNFRLPWPHYDFWPHLYIPKTPCIKKN